LAHLSTLKSSSILIVFFISTIIYLLIGTNTVSNVYAAPPIAFTHGVASGDVTSSTAVLWVRSTLSSLPVDRKNPVIVEVSTNPDFKRVDFRQAFQTQAQNDFTAKALATDLQPGQLYYYRWRLGFSISEVGTFKTAAAPSSPATVKFAWTGDSDVSKINGAPAFNNWESLDAAAAEGLDFFIYLGDTIYSDFRAGGRLPDAQTLEEFRQLYKDSRDVPALHNLLLATSVYPLWDDHEVRNDWDAQTVDPFFYQIGAKAFDEYMPIQANDIPLDPGCSGLPQFRVFHWGLEVDLIIIDARSCRSASVEQQCNNDLAPTLPSSIRSSLPSFFPPQLPAGCLDAINDPTRTMLGDTQKTLLKHALQSSAAKFKFVVSPVSIQQTYIRPYDGWEGYAAERTELLNFIRDNNIRNVIFLTTDLHENLMNEVFVDRFTNPAPVAYEFITGPIATVTDEKLILGSFPPNIGPIAVAAKQNILSLVGVDCRHLNVYSYGSVNVDPSSGTVTVALKDDSGNIIHDQVNPAIQCVKTIAGS
jgi:alkaline phosphatase D